MSDLKRFDEWEEVNCNDCSRYWDSSCDGVSKGSRKGCNSYLATRSVILPEQIKKLEKRIEWLEWAVGIMLLGLGIAFMVVCL